MAASEKAKNSLKVGLYLAEAVSKHEYAWLKGDVDSSEDLKYALSRLKTHLEHLKLSDCVHLTQEISKKWADTFLGSHHQACYKLSHLLPDNIYELAPDEKETSGRHLPISRVLAGLSINVCSSNVESGSRLKEDILCRGLSEGYCFTDQNGEQFMPNSKLSAEFKRLIVKPSGIEDFSLHTLRHTFASHLVMKGVSIYKVSRDTRALTPQ